MLESDDNQPHPAALFLNKDSVNQAVNYRADIDGLRAVAVTLVLLYHAFPHQIPGGFVGVDLFFVISGYLITGILLRERQQGTFSILRFYQRRILRIFPVLILVLFSCFVYGWLTLMASEFAQLCTLIAASASFVANEALREQSGYFDFASSTKPLLHLWSLGIEEQFYLIWPALLALTAAFSASRLKSYAWVLLILSFLLNLFFVHRFPETVFYSIPTRFWELMAGGMLALDQFERPGCRMRRPIVWATISVVLLLLPVCLITPDSAFPGWWAALPVLAAMGLIATGPNTPLHRMLGARWPVALGLISYPLYIWHWPILVFLRQAEFGYATPWLRLLALFISLILAWLSYRWIELPIRFARHHRNTITTALLVLMLAIGITGWIGREQDGFPDRPQAMRYTDQDDASGDWNYPGIGFDGIHLKTHRILGRTAHQILFLGDSHMEQFWPRLIHLYARHPGQYTLVFATYDGCPFIPGLNRPAAPEVPAGGCAYVYQAALALAQRPEVVRIVIDNYWERYQSWPGFNQGMIALGQQLQTWTENGRPVFVLASNPSGRFFVPQNQVQRLPFLNRQTRLVPRSQIEAKRTAMPWVLALIARSHAQLIDPVDEICDDQVCPTVDDNGDPINKDANHFRAGWAEDEADLIDQTVLP